MPPVQWLLLTAFKMAVKSRKDKGLAFIHHSDRGFQYLADNYQSALYMNGIKILKRYIITKAWITSIVSLQKHGRIISAKTD